MQMLDTEPLRRSVSRSASDTAFAAIRQLGQSRRIGLIQARIFGPYNPFDSRHYEDPYAMFPAVREHGPVRYQRLTQMWIVSGFDEVAAVFRSSSTVDRLPLMKEFKPYSALSQQTLDVLQLTLGMLDPPHHTRVRHVVAPLFSPSRMASLRPMIEEIASDLLDSLAGRSRFDAMSTFCSQIPLRTVGFLLGLDDAALPRMQEIASLLPAAFDPFTGFDPIAFDRAMQDAVEIMQAAIDQARRSPSDTVLSRLVHQDPALTEDEIMANAILLAAAGYETTTGALGNSLRALAMAPDQRAMLIERSELIPNAVEELLRFESPVMTSDRTLTEDLEVGGYTIPAGDVAFLLIGCANRDPRKFERPDELLVDRPKPTPLSFGQGIHYCVGAALARLEMSVGLSAFLGRYPEYKVDHTQTEWSRSTFLHEPTRLIVHPTKLSK